MDRPFPIWGTRADSAYLLAVKHGVPTGWGSDILFDAKTSKQQGQNLPYIKRWFTPAQALVPAT